MYARVSTIKTGVQAIDGAIRHFKDVTLPKVRPLRGFRGATLLADRESGITRALTYWDSREALDASAEAANRVRAEFVEKTGAAEIISVEVFEVAVQEVSAGAAS